MVDTSELQIRTMEQLLEDFDGEVESALKMKNLIYTLFQRPTGPEDGSEVPVADQGGTQVDGVWSSDSGGPVLPGNAAIATDGVATTVIDAGATQAQAAIAVGDGEILLVGLAQTSECIVQNSASTTVMAMNGSSAPASISVFGGNVDEVTLTQGTDTIVSDGETFPVTGTGTTATIEVSNGSISIVLS